MSVDSRAMNQQTTRRVNGIVVLRCNSVRHMLTLALCFLLQVLRDMPLLREYPGLNLSKCRLL